MLGIMDTTEGVAFYRVASQIAGLGLLAQLAVNVVIAPHTAALNATEEHDRMQALAVRGSRIALGLAILFTCLLLLMGRGGFVLLLGEDYAPVYALVVLLSFGIVANAVFGGTTTMLNMTGREKSSSNYAISTAIVNIGLNLVLIPVYGVHGAAFATILTNVIMQVLSWRRLKIDLGIRTDAFGRIRS